jgi:spoIIIJ-associated protein
MSEDREFEGKDLEEALQLASESLGTAQADLDYEMLEQGRRGLLGLGTKAVRIRVHPPLAPEPAARPAGEAAKRAAPREMKQPSPEKPRPAAEPALVQEVEKTVQQIIRGTGLDLDVEARPHGGGVELQLKGRDEKMLTARNAELLAAIQFLLSRMARRAWPGIGRINIASDGNARPRDEELVSMVARVAKQVASTGKTRVLQAMNAYERRLVHLTIRDHPGLTSNSDGEGALKRVRISKVRNQI